MWTDLFERHILERGFEYYLSDTVKNVRQNAVKITAEVMGTQIYEIEINCTNGDITSMLCTCPYFEGGHNCKHLAAVLYKIDKFAVKQAQTMLTEENRPNQAPEKIISAVNKVPVDCLRAFLITSLQNDAKLYNSFLLATNQEKINIVTIKDNISEMLADLSSDEEDEYGYDDYYDGYYEDNDYESILEFEDFLTKNVTKLLQLKQAEDAFELVIFTFEKTERYTLDDFDSELIDIYLELWEKIFRQSSIKDRQKIFKLLIIGSEKRANGLLSKYAIDFLVNNYNENEYLPELIAHCKKILENYADSNKQDLYRREEEHLFGQLSTLLQNYETDYNKIKVLCKKYWKLSEARKYFVSVLIERKEYENAIKVLEESKLTDKDNQNKVWQYNLMLKDIYKNMDHQKYILHLTKMVIQAPRQIDLYQELRAQYSTEEWKEKYLPNLLKNINNMSGVEKIYKEEGMKKELMKFIERRNDLDTLKEYEEYLKTKCSKEILSMYTRLLMQDVQNASNRKKYQEVVAQLRHMRLFNGGDLLVEVLIRKWKAQYPRRRAMMEELDKI